MERTIRVTGRGKIAVKPDRIRLNITITGVHRRYADAVAKSSEQTGLLRETIAKAGLEPKDLKTVQFGINSKYEGYHDKNGEWKQRFKGYEYTHRLYIAFDNDNKLLGRALYELSESPVKAEFSIAHTVNDPEAVKNALLGKAVADSREKAAVLAAAAGVKLGDIVTIDYSWGEVEFVSRPMNGVMMAKACVAEEDGMMDMDIEADDIDVEDTVTIVWAIS